jgi:hypothetical protein
MKFVYPEFLWGLTALSIPIIIHLFHFRRYKTLYFSSLKFLQYLDQQQKSVRTLKHWIILALRMLAIIFLVLAFAQPFKPVDDSLNEMGNPLLSIYIDNSFSMSAKGTEGELLSEAREKARKMLNEVPLETRILLHTNLMNGIESRLISKVEALEKSTEAKIDELTRKNAEKLAKMAAECKEKVDSAVKEKNDKIEAMARDHSEKLAKNTQECNKKVADAEKEKNDKIAALQADHNAKIEALTKDANEKVNKITKEKDAKVEAITKHFSQLIDQTKKEADEKNEKAAAEHAEKLASLNKNYKEKIAETETQAFERVKKVQNEAHEQLTKASVQHKKREDELNDAIEN